MLCLKEKDKTKLTAGFLAEAPGRPFTELRSTSGHQGVQSWTHWNRKRSSETDSGSTVQIPEGSSWQELGIWKLSLMEYLKPQEFAKVENVERRGKKQPMPALLGTPTTQSPFTGQLGDEDATKMSEEAAQEEEPGGVCKVFPEGGHDNWSKCCCFHARRSSFSE